MYSDIYQTWGFDSHGEVSIMCEGVEHAGKIVKYNIDKDTISLKWILLCGSTVFFEEGIDGVNKNIDPKEWQLKGSVFQAEEDQVCSECKRITGK